LVEEVLRLEAPAQGLFRTATRDAEIGGTFVPAGSHIWLVFASANRDPDGFPVGDTLTLQDALTRRHLSFGKGEHFCLGSPLARMEARISIEVMLARFAHIELDIADADIEYHPNFVIHGIKALPLILRKQD
jgi:cytochrome P450